MKGELSRVVAGDRLYDEQDDAELEIIDVFPERGVIQVATEDETEFRDLVETLAALKAGRLVRVAEDETDSADDSGDDPDAEADEDEDDSEDDGAEDDD
jgi:uncharacterized protein (DUF2126 family)